MLNNKFFGTLVAIIAVIFAIFKLKFNKDSRENFFLNVPMTYKMNREISTTGSTANLFSIPGNYQAILSPRFSNVDYGAHIRYNMPSCNNQAVPANPIPMSPMGYGEVIESFCNRPGCGGCSACSGGCKSPPSCSKGGIMGNIQQAAHGQGANASWALNRESLNYTPAGDLLPVGDMSVKNSMGGKNPIIYDRYIYANQRSRLYGLGDPIRGDLPIVPCKNEWFRPSVHPHIDLRDGAISVIAGTRNQTSNQLHALQSASTGGVYNTLGGVNYSTPKNSQLFAGQRDLQVTAFP
jgi:hypothetical protein